MKVQELQAKSIMTKSNLPGYDYVINPYTGCAFSCAYCYASFMGRFVNEPLESWGKYVYAKTNAVELLDSQLIKMRSKDKPIFMSSVTDAWQYVEKNYELTRGILQTLLKHNYTGKITCLTKSGLILRDLDIIKQLPNVEVGFTITSAKNEISRELEISAPNVEGRLKALKQFNDVGIKTYVFIGPVLPYFLNHKDDLEELFKQIKQAGITDLYIDMLNTKEYIRKNLEPVVKKQAEPEQKAYLQVKGKTYLVDELRELLYTMVVKYNFNLRNKI